MIDPRTVAARKRIVAALANGATYSTAELAEKLHMGHVTMHRHLTRMHNAEPRLVNAVSQVAPSGRPVTLYGLAGAGEAA